MGQAGQPVDGQTAGDAAARGERFRALVLPHLDAAYNLARWLSGSASDADDVVQEACMRALRFVDSCRGDNARPWLLTIVRHTWYSEWRRRTHAHEVAAPDTLEDADVPDDWQPATADPLAQLLRGENVRLVNAALAKLPAEYREVLVLREMEDLSYREIAAIADVPIGTVMSRLARGRRRLAAHAGRRIGIGGYRWTVTKRARCWMRTSTASCRRRMRCGSSSTSTNASCAGESASGSSRSRMPCGPPTIIARRTRCARGSPRCSRRRRCRRRPRRWAIERGRNGRATADSVRPPSRSRAAGGGFHGSAVAPLPRARLPRHRARARRRCRGSAGALRSSSRWRQRAASRCPRIAPRPTARSTNSSQATSARDCRRAIST
nr:RNA polymerase sigma factor [Burkholderia multivorans]